MKELIIPSSSDSISLSTLVTEPSSAPKAVLQIVHGMAEHKERYIPLMNYLSDRGYVCVINDLRGHGKSVSTPDDLGYMGKVGWKGLVHDEHDVTEWIQKEYKDIPLFLFGHSMGSLIVRSYCKTFDNDIHGLIVCGSPSANPLVGTGKFIASCIKLFKGSRFRSPLLTKLTTGAYGKKFRKEAPNAWICSDPAVVDAYNRDPLCGFPFTVNGYTALFNLLEDVYSNKGWLVRNHSLPVLFIAGSEDPCIDGINNFSKAVSFFRSVGYSSVTSKVYPKMRHEIHNEIGKETVWEDIADTLDRWVG